MYLESIGSFDPCSFIMFNPAARKFFVMNRSIQKKALGNESLYCVSNNLGERLFIPVSAGRLKRGKLSF